MIDLPYLLRLALYMFIVYAVGAIPFGFITARFLGRDITREGSGNIGATNVARVLGPLPGALVLLLDCLKGLFAVASSRYFFIDSCKYPYGFQYPVEALIGASVAVLAHSYSVFLGFKGGKGVATALGAVILLFPYQVLLGVTVFAVLVLAGRIVSVGSLLGTSVVAFSVIVDPLLPLESKLFVLAAALLIFYRHRTNIIRIFKGNESIFKFRSGR
jgi:glycerol-3-phosphate acyltransferase PlsY